MTNQNQLRKARIALTIIIVPVIENWEELWSRCVFLFFFPRKISNHN